MPLDHRVKKLFGLLLLQNMLDYCSIRQDSTPERKQALVYAISSLKTDEAYRLMYEGEEVADLKLLFQDIKKKYPLQTIYRAYEEVLG